MEGATMKAWLLVLCTGLNFYLLGVMVLFAAVVYPQFSVGDRAAFTAGYSHFNAHIGLPVVLFEFAAFLLPLAFYRWGNVPAALVHAVTALGIAYLAITFAWHLPSHRPLAAGDNSAAVMASLLASQWTRTVVQFARAGVLAWLCVRAITQQHRAS
jgi:hypothetical protein